MARPKGDIDRRILAAALDRFLTGLVTVLPFVAFAGTVATA